MKQSLGSRLALLLAVCSVIGLAWPTLPHAAPVHDVNDDSAFDATQVGDSAPAPVIKKSTSKAHATKSHNFKTVHRSKKHSAKKYSTKKTKPSKLPHKQSF
ncbi:MAG: hypothetical protein K2Q32_08030, partial [Alphaproteobacteria bacterium]|nr:hypothetical protein [Alphaproteobacteria bacterium]